MAEIMNISRGAVVASLAALLTAAAAAVAQPVADPTRPPLPATALVTHRAENALQTGAAAAKPVAAPRLQAIQLWRGGAASALVDGNVLRLGDRLGDQTVAAIDAQGITLRGARGSNQVLHLLDGPSKTPRGDLHNNGIALSAISHQDIP